MDYIEYIDFSNEKILKNLLHELHEELADLDASRCENDYDDESDPVPPYELYLMYKRECELIVNNANSAFEAFVKKSTTAEKVYRWFVVDYPNISDSWTSDVFHTFIESSDVTDCSPFSCEEVLTSLQECYQIYLDHFHPELATGGRNEQ